MMNSSDQQMNSITYIEPKLYKAAEAGNINPFQDFPTSLSELLTPQKNTILHVYLANQRSGSKSTDFVGQIIDKCPQLLLQANTKGETPLHFAARYGRSNAVEVLIERAKARSTDLERGATEAKNMLRMANEENDTALHVAARNIQAQVVKILTTEDPEFSYSANVHGETPLYIAANMRFSGLSDEENRKKVIDEILSNCESVEYCGSHGRTALHAAAMRGDHETARKILERDERLTRRDERLTRRTDDDGWSPLHYAAFFPDSSNGEPTVKALLDHDVSAAYIVDSEKRTALHLAAARGHLAAVRVIMNTCRACCELVDSRGWNALHYAATTRRGQLRFPRWIAYFDEFKYEKDNDGNTPLHLYAAFGNFRRVYTRSDWGHAYKRMCGLNKQNLSVDDILVGNFPEKKKVLLESLKDVRSGPLQRPIAMMKVDDLSITERGIEAHIVVAALVATVTFAAVFTMPGGYKNEQGTPVLLKNAAFAVFVISDAIAMVLSTSALYMHFYWAMLGKRGQLEEDIKANFSGWTAVLTRWAILAMVIAFITANYAVLAPSLWLAITTCFIGAAFFYIPYKAFTVRKEILESLKYVRSGPLQRPVTMMKTEDFSITEKGIEAHIVVAALVATVTFAAAFTMPGGYKNEEGNPVLLKNAAFAVFVISDAMAMVFSTSALYIHFIWVLLEKSGEVDEDLKEYFFLWTATLTLYAILAMVIAFITGSYAVLAPSSRLAITTCFIGVAFFIIAFTIQYGHRIFKRVI